MKNIVFENLLRIANDKFGLTRKKDIAEKIGANSQKMTNWKNRGVPPAEHQNIAMKLGVTIDDLVSADWMDQRHDESHNATHTHPDLTTLQERYNSSPEDIQKAVDKLLEGSSSNSFPAGFSDSLIALIESQIQSKFISHKNELYE